MTALSSETGQLTQGESPSSPPRPYAPNVGESERWASTLGGLGLIALGLSRRSLGGLAVAAVGGSLVYRGTTGQCSVYRALNINTAGDPGAPSAQPEEYSDRGVHVVQHFTILKSPEELYAYWRDFENLPKFMKHVESVKKIDDKRSHWSVKGPAGKTVQWDAEIINDEPNRLIAWRSVGGADVDNAGTVRFRPAGADRGTDVSVTLDYIPPAGTIGAWVAKLFGREPTQTVREDLRRFKQQMEAGEIATTEGQPRGECV